MLELNNVNVKYGKVQALSNVNMKVERGSIVALLGANGAGKSTTLNAISGVAAVSSGEILFDGVPIHGIDSSDIVAKGIVQCPEGRQIFTRLTVAENLRIGSYLRKDTASIKKDMERVLGFFPRLKERLNQPAGTLSGGEQQMLAIGRALMGSPRLLMLDEPSLGLAPIIMQEIFQIITDINKTGTSILLVEQNVQMSIKIATKAYVLELGRIALSGTAEELRKNDEIRKLYLGAH